MNKEIAKRIRKLAKQLDDAWDEDNNFELDQNRVEAVYDALREYACELTSHDFGPDQCGYWHHYYCFKCGKMQHPEISKLSCGEFEKKHGKMTEQEWLNKTKPEQ